MTDTTRVAPAAAGATSHFAAARPSPGAPVLLLHPWWGLNQTICDLADRLAGDGFTVMAPDLFGGTVLTTPGEAEAFVSSIGTGTVTKESIRSASRAALEELLASPEASGDRAAIIGLSFGAMQAMELLDGRSDIAALVCFYSGIFEAPAGLPYLGHFAEHDEFDDSAGVPEFEKTLDEDSAAYIYPGTKHWFLEADRPEYDAGAAELAYARTVAFLREHLVPTDG
ncbi:MAG: alpha/beta fold hydrolase [Chloroflexota bacterium]